MSSIDNRLPAEAFCYLGKSLFGEPGWQAKMAVELKVDEPSIEQWATEGPPANLAKKLSQIAGYYRGQIQAPLTMDGMPDADLKPWERAGRLLNEYEGLSPDPTMIYSSAEDEDNRDMVVRVIADMLHYCMHKMSVNRTFIDMDAMIQEAIAIYNSEPHSAVPIKRPEVLPKEFIPYVLTADPAKIAAFEKKFGITQDQAVDELIEITDWGGEDLPQLVGNKGTAAERLRELRRVLRAAGEHE
jgi:hypothetical protein